jgi:predicted enzyme related to lactoylglutathione lyase
MGRPLKIVAAGGKICVEEQTVADRGAVSLFSDLEGRLMGLRKPEVGI